VYSSSEHCNIFNFLDDFRFVDSKTWEDNSAQTWPYRNLEVVIDFLEAFCNKNLKTKVNKKMILISQKQNE